MAAYCRLCLQVASDLDGPLINIFTQDDVSPGNKTLASKICQSIGIYVGPEHGQVSVCGNCQATVQLIDDFRNMCLQTDTVYQSSSRGVTVKVNKRTEYNQCVGKLRTLLQEHRKAIDAALAIGNERENIKIESIDIKEEPLEDDSDDDDVLSEGSDIDEEVEDQSDGGQDVNDEKLKKRIKMVKAISERLSLFTCETPDVNYLWRQIADQLGCDELDVRQRWSTLARYVRTRMRREKAGKMFQPNPSELFQLILKIVTTMDEWNAAQRQDRLSVKLMTRLATEVKSDPVLWDPSYQGVVADNQNEGWRVIAGKLQLDVPTVLDHWGRLLRMYGIHREHEKRTAERIPCKGNLTRVMTLLQEMLEPDLAKNKLVNEPSKPESTNRKAPAGKRKRPWRKVQMEEKLALAKHFLGYEHLWNKQHPHNQHVLKRRETYEAIAAHFGITRTKVNREWARLRVMYHCLRHRNGGSSANRELNALLQQLFGGNNADETDVSPPPVAPAPTGSKRKVASKNKRATKLPKLENH